MILMQEGVTCVIWNGSCASGKEEEEDILGIGSVLKVSLDTSIEKLKVIRIMLLKML